MMHKTFRSWPIMIAWFRKHYHNHPSIAIKQSQPAETPPEASMSTTVINNIVETVAKLGSDIVAGDALDLAGKHYIAVTDGGITRLLDVDSKVVTDVQPNQSYVPITAVITLSA